MRHDHFPNPPALTATPPADAPAAQRFDAFISYGRGADTSLAVAIEQGLKRFAKPLLRLRALEVFRDDAAMGANPGLWPAIAAALDCSRGLILVASPKAAASAWVARELDHWLGRHQATSLFLVLSEGELVWDAAAGRFDIARSTALPPTLAGRFAAEPRWVDLRWARAQTDLSLDNLRLREAIADLAAPLHGRPKDALIGEDVRQHHRLRRLGRGALTMLAALSIGLALAVREANQQRAAAQVQAVEARAQRDTALLTQSRFLADLAHQRIDDGDAVTGMLLALRALPRADERPHVPEAEGALRRALAEQREVALFDARGAPNDATYALALTPDGQMLAGAVSSHIVLWDMATRDRLRVLEGHDKPVLGVAFSPDGRALASASQDGTVRLWERDSGREVHRLDAGGVAVRCVTFSRDGALLAAGSDDGKVRLWAADSGRPVRSLDAHRHWVRALVFLPDGERLATAGNDGRIRLWRVDDGALLRTIDTGRDWLTALAVSPVGRTLFAAGANPVIRAWNVDDGRLLGRLSGHTQPVASLDVNAAGTHLLSGSFDGSLRVWDLASGRALQTLRGHSGWVSAARFNAEGRSAVSAAFDGTLRLWRLGAAPGLDRLAAEDQGVVRATALAPDDSQLAAGDRKGTVLVWDLASHRLRRRFGGPGGAVLALAFSPDGRQLAAGTQDHRLRLWDTASGTVLQTLEAHAAPVEAIAFSPDGSRLLTGARDGAVAVWDVRSGERRLPIAAGAEVLDAGWTADGGQVLAVLADGNLRRWNAQTGAAAPSLMLVEGGAAGAALSPDGRWVLTVSGLALKLWDAGSGRLLADTRLGAPVNSLHFSPDGHSVVVASAGGDVLLYAATDLRRRHRLPWAHLMGARADAPDLLPTLIDVHLTRDGDRVVFAPDAPELRVWFAGRDPAALMRHARTRLTRCLTVADEVRYFLRATDDARPVADCRRDAPTPDTVDGPTQAVPFHEFPPADRRGVGQRGGQGQIGDAHFAHQQ